MDILNGLATDQVVWGIVTATVLLTAADLIVGIGMAFAHKAFTTTMVADFIQTHVMGRVLPITALAILGHWEPSLAALGAAAAAAYAVETIGSIKESVVPAPESPTVG